MTKNKEHLMLPTLFQENINRLYSRDFGDKLRASEFKAAVLVNTFLALIIVLLVFIVK